jgi:hypothetical protein
MNASLRDKKTSYKVNMQNTIYCFLPLIINMVFNKNNHKYLIKTIRNIIIYLPFFFFIIIFNLIK